MKMRPLVLIGLILAVLGLVALAVPSFTFFTSSWSLWGFVQVPPEKLASKPDMGTV
jgi:uncharacterized membrane protein HdeD (DUF308 family)